MNNISLLLIGTFVSVLIVLWSGIKIISKKKSYKTLNTFAISTFTFLYFLYALTSNKNTNELSENDNAESCQKIKTEAVNLRLQLGKKYPNLGYNQKHIYIAKLKDSLYHLSTEDCDVIEREAFKFLPILKQARQEI